MVADKFKSRPSSRDPLICHSAIKPTSRQVLGAGGGELAARYIAGQLFPGRKVEQLSESEKKQVSALSELAAGLAGGMATGDTAGALTAAQAGKNAVENNALSLTSGMMDYGQAAASWNQYAMDNNLTPEQTQAGLDKQAKGDLPEGANVTKVIVNGYKDGMLIAGAAYLGPAASVGKVVGGAVLAEIANGTYQWFDLSQPGNENKSWDYKESISSGITGALAPRRSVWSNAGIALGGTLFTDGPDNGALTGIGADDVLRRCSSSPNGYSMDKSNTTWRWYSDIFTYSAK
jgi:filamentous hemagglutinin